MSMCFAILQCSPNIYYSTSIPIVLEHGALLLLLYLPIPMLYKAIKVHIN